MRECPPQGRSIPTMVPPSIKNDGFRSIVTALDDHAARTPAKAAMICMGREVTFGEWRDRSAALANFLLDLGLKKGDRVGMLLEKTPEIPITFLGAASVGAVVFPIDYHMRKEHLRSLFQLTRPSALVVAENLESRLPDVKAICPEDRVIVAGKPSVKGRHALPEALSGASSGFPRFPLHGDDPVYLNFTSGTTGFPKGAVTTYGNLYWNTVSAVEALRLTSEDVHLCLFPAFGHPHEFFARSLYLGGTTVLVEGVLPKSIAKAVAEHGVTCTMGAASIYAALVKNRDALLGNRSSLRVAESGGMHVNPALQDSFRQRFNVHLIPVWGSTETTGIALASPLEYSGPPGSMGRPCPHYEVEVVDGSSEFCPPGKIGEMIVRGPGVVREYFNNTSETRKYLRERWFFTGDLAMRDSEGFFHFVGRKTGMMKVAGMKVFPTEIEDVLSAHPKIAEVAITSMSDPSRGEAPKAVIVLKEGERLDNQSLRKYCEERLERHKIPRVFEFTEELPKTPGGKILYREL